MKINRNYYFILFKIIMKKREDKEYKKNLSKVHFFNNF